MSTEKKKLSIIQPEDLPTDESVFSSNYQLDWSQLKRSAPDWFCDAKFGLCFHYGPYCVPAKENEWYSRNMYTKGHYAYNHHLETYGNLSEHGYKDFYDDLHASNFNANEWVELVIRSGAKYSGFTAEHSDGFSLWDSKINPANSINFGPKRDMVKELSHALKSKGIKFAATFHHAWLWGWFGSSDPDADVYDPKNEMFYGKILPYSATKYIPTPMPDDDFCNVWLEKLVEVIDAYIPDMIFFDSRTCVVKEEYRKRFLEYYYDAAKKAGIEPVVTYKQEDMPEGTAVRDLECSRFDDVSPEPWQTEDKSDWKSWCHIDNPRLKRPQTIVHLLCDVVSKNGCLMLNAGPRADGTFDERVKELLFEIGDWLKVNGEAIYHSRPFTTFGEGPTVPQEHVRKESDLNPYTGEDVRFTTKGNDIYAILLGRPYAGKAVISTLRDSGELKRKIMSVTMLGHNKPLEFTLDKTALVVTLPEEMPCKYAYTLKIVSE